MASYGPIYEFAFDSQNGADILIVISKKSYTGAVTRRPLGRAPILKRENNENIYGTSLEIYAECKVDGEYAEFYTSSADEFKVDVYKDQVLIWTGFITPELYSEPDIAPPYDVQIIATDGLGELRDLAFYSNETKSVYEHIKSMLDAMNATRLYGIISDLKYVSGDFVSGAAGLFDMRVNLEHEVGNNCYDVLQNILRSINASMTLYGDSWLIFRKTDFIRLAEEDWVHGAYSNGHETLYPVAEFGSMDKTNWWPIGQMSSVIEPAKKSVVFQAPNHYKRNALSDAWVISDSTSYDNIQKAYTLSSKDAYITQHIDFGAEIGYALSLKIKAMNVGAPIFDIKKGNYIDQGIGVRVKVVDEDGHPMYLESLDSDRGIGSYHWVSDESTWIEGDLALPALSDRKSDAQEVEIIIPLYVSTPMSKALATSMDVTVFNIDGTYPINIYNISLGAHEKAPGYEANVVLNNNAREEGDSVEATFSDAYRLANAGYIFMSGIPMLPYQDVAIGSWQIDDGEVRDYVTTMAEDYAMQSALPRMSYRGVLNVPRASLPVLFLRDGTYYFPRTYSYNLYDDELEVELISVPAADVEVSSIVVSEYTPSYGASSGSSGGSGSGGGSGIGGGIDLSGYAKKEEVTTLSELLASMWTIDEVTGDLVTDRNVRIAKNVIIGGDMSSAAKGRDAGAAGGIIGVKVGDAEYTDIIDGLLDMTDAFKDLDVDLSDYYTSDETDAKIAESLIPYAKIADVSSTYATKASLATLQTEVDNIEAILGMDEEAAGIINTWNEVKAFLGTIEVGDDLTSILERMNADIAKRALDSDLDTLAGRVGVNELAIADNAGNIKKNFDAIGTLESNKADKATTLAGYGITDAYTKVNVDNLLKKYLLLEAESQTIKGNLKIEGDLIIAGDMSSEGTGGNSGADGTVIGVVVNGTRYEDETNGMLDLSSLMNQYLLKNTLSDRLRLTNGAALAFVDTSNVERMLMPMSWKSNALGWWNGSVWEDVIHSGNYSDYALPKSGGTLSAWGNPLTIERTDGAGPAIAFSGTSGAIGAIGVDYSNEPYFYRTSNKTSYTIIHSGNIGSQTVAAANKLVTSGGADAVTINSSGAVTMSSTLGVTGRLTAGSIYIDSDTYGLGAGQYGPLRIKTTSTFGGNRVIEAVAPNITKGNGLLMYMGVAESKYNGGYFRYRYDGLGSSSNAIQFGFWGADDLVTLLGDGHFGIGTPEPSYKLTVNAETGDQTPAIMVESSTSLQWNYLASFLAADTAKDGGVTISLGKEHSSKKSALITYRYTGDGNTSYLSLHHFGADNLLNILGNGNVGIGTTSPAYKLDVSGAIYASQYVIANYALITKGEYGVWKGSSFSTVRTSDDLVYNAVTHDFRGAVTTSSTLSVGGNVFFKTAGKLDAYGNFHFTSPTTGTWAIVRGNGNDALLVDNATGAVTMSSTLSVAADVTASNMFANTFRTVGEAGMWRGDWYTGALTSNDLAIIGGKIYCYGNTTINGNVGIGVTSPSSSLHISSSTAQDAVIKVESSQTHTVMRALQATFSNASSSALPAIVIGKALAKYDAGVLLYTHVGNGSTSNIFSLSMYGVDNILCVNGAGRVLVNTTTDNAHMLNVRDTRSNNWAGVASFMSTAQTDTHIQIGRAMSTNNSAFLAFHYSSDGSTNNYAGIGFYNTSYLMKISANGSMEVVGALSVGKSISLPKTTSEAASAMANNYISAGGGYGTGTGKYGLKIISCDDDNSQNGLGQDLFGGSYETSLTTTLSTNGVGRIAFGCHANKSTTYTMWGYFDSTGLHVNGNIVMAGDLSSTSDMRLKQRIDDVVFDLKTMAEMPIFTFRWKDGRDDRLHLGSSAQYWEKPAPWLVMGDETKTLNYAVLGVAGVKALAVTAVDHETRIKMLERKVNELETENRRLRYGN